MTESVIQPFAIAAGFWALAGFLGCHVFGGNQAWFLGFWALSLVNIFALGKTLKEILGLVARDSENYEGRVIRAFAWGSLKLVCLGIFIASLIHGLGIHERGAAVVGGLFGASTLFVVPLLGGLGAIGFTTHG